MSSCEWLRSLDVKAFLAKADESIYQKDGHYELSLPVRNSDVVMPNNRERVVNFTGWQKRNILRDKSNNQDDVPFVNRLLETVLLTYAVCTEFHRTLLLVPLEDPINIVYPTCWWLSSINARS